MYMTRAVVLTAYDRPHLLDKTLASLSNVRGKQRWHLFLSLDPCEDTVKRLEVEEVARKWQDALNAEERERGFATVTILRHDQRRGVLHHPYVCFETLFASGFEYVLRLEDDMLFTEDILEYHEWASREYDRTYAMGFVESLSGKQADGEMNTGTHEDVMFTHTFGSPLAIGTWPQIWREVLAPTWDHDYSSGAGTPEDPAGWDWNLALRVYPHYSLVGLRPLRDKVFHTGVEGAHSTPEIYEVRPPLVPVPEKIEYHVVSRRF